LLKATLARTNASVFRAHNGKEAIDLCFKKSVDLVLMDIRMPEMNGYEATEIIKAHAPEIPVISVTAYAMPEDLKKSLQAGCDDHISKPVKPDDLIKRVGKFLFK
jgi:two-component system, cell cycle response regulator DivK